MAADLLASLLVNDNGRTIVSRRILIQRVFIWKDFKLDIEIVGAEAYVLAQAGCATEFPG